MYKSRFQLSLALKLCVFRLCPGVSVDNCYSVKRPTRQALEPTPGGRQAIIQTNNWAINQAAVSVVDPGFLPIYRGSDLWSV